jgi:transposase
MSELRVLATPRKRRRFTAEFKARIVEACQQPVASVAGIALEHPRNANLAHKWNRAARRKEPVSVTPAFIPVPMASTPAPVATQWQSVESIRLSIPGVKGAITIEWPVADGRCHPSCITVPPRSHRRLYTTRQGCIHTR